MSFFQYAKPDGNTPAEGDSPHLPSYIPSPKETPLPTSPSPASPTIFLWALFPFLWASDARSEDFPPPILPTEK